MSEIKKKLKKAYDLMPEGTKKRASEIHGVTPIYFRTLANGGVKDESVLYSVMQAIKQASFEKLSEVQEKVDLIDAIEVKK